MAGQERQGGEASPSQEDDWHHIEDQNERRKIQNRLAQRKFREKEKQKRKDETGIASNQQAAGSAYAPPEAEDLGPNADPAGLPWGSVSIKYAVEAGRAKERDSQRGSREPSAALANRPRGDQRFRNGEHEDFQPGRYEDPGPFRTAGVDI